ncbi:MAG: iron-sulfur cluster assembly protein [Chloroflexota bacterium]
MSENIEEKPNWQIEQTHPLLMKPLMDALSEVNDPEIRLNIVQLGLVRDVIVENEEAKLVMILTTPFCPYGPSLLESARQKAEKALGMPTKVDFSPEPWLPQYLAEEYQDNFGLF